MVVFIFHSVKKINFVFELSLGCHLKKKDKRKGLSFISSRMIRGYIYIYIYIYIPVCTSQNFKIFL